MRSWQLEAVRTPVVPEAFINKSKGVFKEPSTTNELIMKWWWSPLRTGPRKPKWTHHNEKTKASLYPKNCDQRMSTLFDTAHCYVRTSEQWSSLCSTGSVPIPLEVGAPFFYVKNAGELQLSSMATLASCMRTMQSHTDWNLAILLIFRFCRFFVPDFYIWHSEDINYFLQLSYTFSGIFKKKWLLILEPVWYCCSCCFLIYLLFWKYVKKIYFWCQHIKNI
jgi:hypothetical protein